MTANKVTLELSEAEMRALWSCYLAGREDTSAKVAQQTDKSLHRKLSLAIQRAGFRT